VQTVDRGFDSANVLLLQIDPTNRFANSAAYYQAALEKIRSVPGVAAAGVVQDFFIERHADSTITLEGKPPRRLGEPTPPLIRDRVGPGYFEAMRIPLLRGRFFQESDLASTTMGRIGIINDSMARVFWPGEDPVGKRLRWNSAGEWITVVGIVADMRRQKLDEAAIPSMFEPGFSGQMDIAVRTVGDPAALRDAIAAELRALDPAAPPYGVTTVEQRLEQTVSVRRLQTFLLVALAAAALVLAVIGVYGLIHHAVATRTQEIGIRMALGATRGSVLWMTLSGALGLAATGLVLGWMASIALGRAISSFLYETSPLDPLIHVGVAAIVLIVATLASLAPARRASRIDPMTALRCE
jgi:predicted permease